MDTYAATQEFQQRISGSFERKYIYIWRQNRNFVMSTSWEDKDPYFRMVRACRKKRMLSALSASSSTSGPRVHAPPAAGNRPHVRISEQADPRERAGINRRVGARCMPADTKLSRILCTDTNLVRNLFRIEVITQRKISSVTFYKVFYKIIYFHSSNEPEGLIIR